MQNAPAKKTTRGFVSYLNDIQAEQRSMNFIPQPAADPDEIEDFCATSVQQLCVPVPDGYLEFLRHSNGLVHHGTVLYAIDEITSSEQNIPGFIAENKLLRAIPPAPDRCVLHLGYSDTWLYVYDNRNEIYQIMDMTQHHTVFECTDFDEFLTDILRTAFFSSFEDLWDQE